MSFERCLSFKLIIAFCFAASVAFAQQEDREVEKLIEPVIENNAEDFDFTELTEKLNYYRKRPLNLNKANVEQLQELTFLSPLQIYALLEYRKESSIFMDLLELQSIEGFDEKTVQTLLPFVTLVDNNILSGISLTKLFRDGDHDFLLRTGRILENPKGFSVPDSSHKSRYSGSPQKLNLRYKYSFDNRLSIGLVAEKDAGESFLSGRQASGFDFNSGYIFFKSDNKVRKLVIGDYALQFGQGLTLWSGLSFGKGPFIAAIARQDVGIKPYSSTNEALFFRGSAATLSFNKFNFTPFVSYKSLDGKLNDSGDSISTINESGFHRTPTEIEGENKFTQSVLGGVLQYQKQGLKLGAIAYHSRFNKALEKSDSQYNFYELTASGLTNTGLYYNYAFKNFYFFGEAAHSLKSGYAYQAGALISLSSTVSLALLKRNYQKNYRSYFTGALGESGSGNNERGFYSGITLKPVPKLEVSAYSDFFYFPWLKYRVDAPSKGREYLAQATYSFSKALSLLLRGKYETKEENDGEENTVNILEEVKRKSCRAELNYEINKNLRFRNRVEFSEYTKGDSTPEQGYAAFQDVSFNPKKSKFSFEGRFAIFNTSGFNSRIYAYESDVLYSFSSPAFQNKGIRFYLNCRYRVKRGIDFWLRYSTVNYQNQETIGSGLDEIAGNRKSEIKAQVRFQF